MKGDYFVAKMEGKRDYLAKALTDSDKKTVEALVEKDCHIQSMRSTLTVQLTDVVVVLGQDPYAGTVYGHDVGTLFRKRLTHEKFGDVFFFYKPKKEVLEALNASMDSVYTKLKKKGLTFLLHDVVFEVRPYNGKGKYCGMYLKSKNEKVPDRLWIRPEQMTPADYPYVWFHELGHGLHFNYATSKKLNATWLKMWNTSIKVEAVKKDKSQQLLDLLMDGDEPPSDFKRGLDEEDALAFKWIVRTIQQVNGLSIKELDTLFEAEMKEEVRKVWPVRNIPRKELAPIISEYATKHVKELIAEAFAFYMTGKKLPEPVVKLLEKTIEYAKANREKPDGDE